MSENVCKRCQEDMAIPFGYEPTEYCNTCAQTLVVELQEENAILREVITAARAAIQHVASVRDQNRLGWALQAIEKAMGGGGD